MPNFRVVKTTSNGTPPVDLGEFTDVICEQSISILVPLTHHEYVRGMQLLLQPVARFVYGTWYDKSTFFSDQYILIDTDTHKLVPTGRYNTYVRKEPIK